MKHAALLAGVLITGAAQAQTPIAATPAQVAAARAEADRLIGAAHAETYFVNVTTDASPKVRHLPSGLECGFDPGQPNEVHIYQTGIRPGDDISCATRHPLKDGRFTVETLYASRYPQTPTLQQVMGSMIASIRTRSPEAKPVEGKFNTVALTVPGAEPAPPHAAVRLDLAPNGEHFFNRAATGVVRGWVISQRVTAPIDDAEAADAIGELGLGRALIQVQSAVVDDADLGARRIAAQDAASDEAHRLLKGIRDQEAFANLTAGGVARLQHKTSGVICQFGRDAVANRLLQLPTGFACSGGRDFGVENLEVTYTPGLTGAAAQGLVGQFMAAQYPDAQALTGFGDAKATDGAGRPLPDHVTQRFSASTKTGAKLFIRISYATVGDWLIVQRVLGPAPNGGLIDLQAERTMVGYIGELARRQDQPPRVGAVKRP